MIQAGVSQPVPQAPVLAERRPSVLARRWQGFGELIDGVPLVIVDRINVARAGRTVAGAPAARTPPTSCTPEQNGDRPTLELTD